MGEAILKSADQLLVFVIVECIVLMHSQLRPRADAKLMLPPGNMMVHVQTCIGFWTLASAGVTGHNMCMSTTVSLIFIHTCSLYKSNANCIPGMLFCNCLSRLVPS